MDLNDYRTRIDQIDDQLVKLFAERMETVVGIAKYKEEHNLPVLDAGRERKKLLALAEKSPEPEVSEPTVQPEPDPEPVTEPQLSEPPAGPHDAPDSGNFPGDREYPQALSRQRGRGLPGRGGRELAAGL